MNSRRALLGLMALAALLAMALLPRSQDTQHPTLNGRIVLVSHAMPAPSQPGQSLHVELISGTAFDAQAGIVLNDDQCQPDHEGISHCLNRIQLASGETITVRHPHDMSRIACLAPGEHITVQMSDL